MRLNPQIVPDWPKLAWTACFTTRSDSIRILHGPCVEVSDLWCVEAVWAGDFVQGDFDQTDLIFGSGIRCRDDQVLFVSSGTTLDRLWHYRREDAWHVANSLPALMAAANLSIADTEDVLVSDLESISKGLAKYKRQFLCRNGHLGLVYFNNLLWDGRDLREVEKIDTSPTFDSYETYTDYLLLSADKLAGNMTDPARKHCISSLVTVSQGYDSCAAAVVSRRAGCRNAVTIGRSTSFWRGSDSGAEVAGYLGMNCRTYDRTATRYPLEETIWSVAGRAGVMNWTLFDYPEPLCLFFTAPYGDKMWSRYNWNCVDPFEATNLSLGGIGEFRLFKGIFHCPVPFMGMRHVNELRPITFSDAMKPWSIGGDYDRPIPRRLVEEEGVPRSAFGQRKKNTSHDEVLLWPYSPESAASHRRFLREQGKPAPGSSRIRLWRHTANLAHLIEANLPRKLTQSVRLRRKEAMSASAELLFRWANTELSHTYRAALADNLVSTP